MYRARRQIQLADRIYNVGDPVPVVPGRDYAFMVRVGDVEEVPDDPSASTSSDTDVPPEVPEESPQPEQEEVPICPVCKRGFATMAAMRQHYTKTHGE